MEKATTELLSKAPELLITLGVVFLIVYILREYRKIRQENEQAIKDVVNAKLGEIMSKIQSEVSRLEVLSKEQESVLKQVGERYKQFSAEVEEKTASINGLFIQAQEKLSTLREAIPNVDEFSAQELLGLAQSRENPQARAELCSRIVNHPDATCQELELAGDLMRKASRYSIAMQLYEKAHQKDPERTTAQIELLSLQVEIDYDKRSKSLESAKAIVLEKPNRNNFARVSNALIDLDRYEELIAFSRQFIETIGIRNPKLKALALRNMAVALREIGDIQGSLDAYVQAFAIAPEDENILKPYLGLLEEQGKLDEHLALARKLLEIDPASVNYYRIYISALIKRGMFAEAGKWLEKTKPLPKDPMDEARLKEFEQKIRAAANNAIHTEV